MVNSAAHPSPYATSRLRQMLPDNAPYGQMLHHISVADKDSCSEGGLPTNSAKGHTFLC